MRSARQPDTWIILSDPSKGRERTDAPATRGDETLSEFTSETHASSDVKASVTEAAGSTGLKIASRHLPNFTAHEHTAIPSHPQRVPRIRAARTDRIAERSGKEPSCARPGARCSNVDRPSPEHPTPEHPTLPCQRSADVCGRNCNGCFDHVVRHCSAVNDRPNSYTATGTGPPALGDETSRLVSRYGAGRRQRTFNVATTRHRLCCRYERPPK